MNGRQIGSILVAYLAIEISLASLASVPSLVARVVGRGPLEASQILSIVAISLGGALTFAVIPAAVLLSARRLVGGLFDVGEGTLQGAISAPQLGAALLLFIGVNQILLALFAIPTIFLAAGALADQSRLEQAVLLWASVLRMVLGSVLALRARRLAEWWARRTGIAT